MVSIDVQVTFGVNIYVQQAMPGNLVEHVIEKRQPGVKLGLTAAIQIQIDADLSSRVFVKLLRYA